ncbi:MAG: undecaprenyl-diphosphate phosphatase, partial [Bacteroidota bacterium]
METYQVIILAIIQGITEFLPISSSGHLVLLPRVFGWPDQGIFLDVAVHVGSLGAVLVYFWRDVLKIFFGFLSLLRGKVTPGGQLFLMLLIGTLPVVFVGFILDRLGMQKFRSLEVVAFALIGWGSVMFIADRLGRVEKSIKDVHAFGAFLIGIAQSLALIPGTSRSGICMSAMRFLGFKREDAARFSFLLAIPAITGAGGLKIFDAVQSGV